MQSEGDQTRNTGRRDGERARIWENMGGILDELKKKRTLSRVQSPLPRAMRGWSSVPGAVNGGRNEGLRSATEAHQKALQSIPIDRRLSLLDLIRGSEGANTPEGYSQEVLLVVVKEALTSNFAAWLGNLAKKGTLPTLGSLKKLRTLLKDELVFTNKGRASSDEETTGGGGQKRRARKTEWARTVDCRGRIHLFRKLLFVYVGGFEYP